VNHSPKTSERLNYSPPRIAEDVSLNIRSFRRK